MEESVLDKDKAKKLILTSIVCSYWPSYEQMSYDYIKPFGYFDFFRDKWMWNRRRLENEATEEQLCDIIKITAPEMVYFLSLRIEDL